MWTKTQRMMTVLPVLLAIAIPAVAQNPGMLAGKWQGTMTSPRGERTHTLTFAVESGKLTGSVQSNQGEATPLTNLMLGAAGALAYTIKMERGDRTFELSFKGTVSGDKFTGAYTMVGRDRQTPFSATRIGGGGATASAPAGGVTAAALVGTWKGSYTTQRGTREETLTFKLENGQLTGTTSGRRGDRPLSAVSLAADGTLTYVTTGGRPGGQQYTRTFTGKLSGTSFTGKYSSSRGDPIKFTATKQ